MQQIAITFFRKGFANGMVKQFNLCGLDTIHEFLPNRDGADEDDDHAWYHDIYEQLNQCRGCYRGCQIYSNTGVSSDKVQLDSVGLKILLNSRGVCAWRTMLQVYGAKRGQMEAGEGCH